MNKRFVTTLGTFLILCILLAPLPALAKGVVLNFSDVDISTMVKFISDLTGKNFVMDDRVKGKISVFSPAKLSTEEAFNVFTSVLELKGFTVVQAGRVYKIIPTSAAKLSGLKILSDAERPPVNDSYVAQVISLENIASQDAVALLQPVVSKDGYISSFGPANMVLVVDSALNIRKVLSIIEIIDAEPQREKAELLFLKNAGAENVASVVREWLGSKDKNAKPGTQQPSGGGTAAGGIGPRIVADSRLNALIMFGNSRDKEEIRRLVALIDVVPPTSSSKINVYYLENADATEVSKVLDGVIKGAAAIVPGAPQTTPQLSPFEGGKVSITPDKATNSLVVLASPTDYQNLTQVIQKLDKQRRQVFVQAIIAEVSLNKLRDLGIEWGTLGAAATSAIGVVGLYDPYSTVTNTLTSLLSALSTAGLSGDNLKLSSAANFAAVLKALETNGAVNVLSTPTILTSDNKEAEIFVGENVPFKGNVTISNTTTPSFQSIDRKDTGITLKITPQISEGEFIKLDIYQEISAVNTTTVAGASDLITTKRSAKTAVVVKNQETVAIGGLIQDKETKNINQVPFLGSIPILGYLFKSESITRDKTNLMILLTPRIIKGAKDLTEVTGQQKARFEDESTRTTPFDLGSTLKRTETNQVEQKPQP